MHPVFFGLKRAHHGTLRITREPLREVGLTPARFDLLYAVKESRGGLLQSALRRVLGVSRATASKMLISLEELGMVKRTVYPCDRRQRLVRLTGLGRQCIRGATRDFLRSGWAELAFASAVSSTGLYRWQDPESMAEARSWLLARLDALRAAFFDFASLEFPVAYREQAERIEDAAFEDPWELVAALEERDGLGEAPAGARAWSWSPESVRRSGAQERGWSQGACRQSASEALAPRGTGASIVGVGAGAGAGAGTCPFAVPLRFPWDDEGARTWAEREEQEKREARKAASAGRGSGAAGRSSQGDASRRA